MPHLKLIKVRQTQEGFNLIEVMIAIFVLAIGLLGMASIQLTGLRSNQSAYFRTQASILAYDIADRMRANSAQALATGYVQGDDTPFNTTGAALAIPACALFTSNLGPQNPAGCSDREQATADLAEWTERVVNANNDVSLLPSASATITRTNQNIFTVQVQWVENDLNEIDDVDDDGNLATTENNTFSMTFAL